MSKTNFDDKTYRIIDIDGHLYDGKDGSKGRLPNYVVDAFGDGYFKGKRVLDLACASGAILFAIREQIESGTGVDVDSKKLNIGKLIAHDHDFQHLNFHEEKLESFLERNDESFDCVFMLNILHHLQDPYRMLDIVAEICDDTICVEAPVKGFYRAYPRDHHLTPLFDKVDISDITQHLASRNYELIVQNKSENQESFIGPERYVSIYKKKS